MAWRQPGGKPLSNQWWLVYWRIYTLLGFNELICCWGNPMIVPINTLRPRQNCHHFADDISKCIFLIENVWISLHISLKFLPKVRIKNIPALFQIMAWRRSGDKPLSEPMMVKLLTHICGTRPQWVNSFIANGMLHLFQLNPISVK